MDRVKCTSYFNFRMPYIKDEDVIQVTWCLCFQLSIIDFVKEISLNETNDPLLWYVISTAMAAEVQRQENK